MERQNYGDSKKIQINTEEGMNRQDTEGNFRAVNLICMTGQQWIHVIIHLSRPSEYTTPTGNPW